MKTQRVCFPHMGNYFVAEKTLATLVGDEVVVPPPTTKRTLELGAQYSPESVCVPFKYTLGNYIEALETGANVIVQIGGGCRLGCYGELQHAILRRLGYEFEFIQMTNDHGMSHLVRCVRQIRPQHSYVHICKVFCLAIEKARAIDEIEDYIRKNIGFETRQGSFERLNKQFLAELDLASSLVDTWDVKRQFAAEFRRLGVQKPATPLRVGFVGEFFVVLEPFSNFFIEKELARYGIEVHRPLSIGGTLWHSTFYDHHIRQLLKCATPYLTHPLGAHGTESVAKAVSFAKQAFDGLIHVKPFGCMPEINAIPALRRVSDDFQFPILYFSFDSLTSETGIKTRLEAFYDMLTMRKVRHE